MHKREAFDCKIFIWFHSLFYAPYNIFSYYLCNSFFFPFSLFFHEKSSRYMKTPTGLDWFSFPFFTFYISFSIPDYSHHLTQIFPTANMCMNGVFSQFLFRNKLNWLMLQPHCLVCVYVHECVCAHKWLRSVVVYY